ncbi:MAG TPA: aspartate--tRNA(Asn) ligase [Nanoarchaeota archaeon]|nr:aspartate--tRNA(Asn) ligase [Nanoarchaeota archaeon]
MLEERISTSNIKSGSVVVAGWVREIRDFGKLKFIILADREGEVQITAKANEVESEILEIIDKLGKEDVIVVKGNVRENEKAPGGKEIVPEKIEILNTSERVLPLEIRSKAKAELSTRLDNRFLDLRKKEVLAIFKIRSQVANAIREFFHENGFIEIHTPKIVASATESGANVFPILYFEKEAFLAQSPQFYKQACVVGGFEKVFEIAPAFRAEKHHTIRHLTEYTSVDAEIGFIKSHEDVMKVVENLIKYIFEKVLERCKKELNMLNVELSVPKLPIKRITMREAYKLLEKEGYSVEYGDELNTEAEKLFGKIVKEKFGTDFVFLTEFPWKVRPFYTYRKENEPEWTKSFDLIYKGIEIVTGGQREHRYEILLSQCKEKGVTPEKIEFYLKMFKYGAPPHGGFGLGLDRLIMLMLNLSNVREATLFPRDPERLEP